MSQQEISPSSEGGLRRREGASSSRYLRYNGQELARDLSAARRAYETGDVNASRLAHVTRPAEVTLNEPGHVYRSGSKGSELIRKKAMECAEVAVGQSVIVLAVLAGNRLLSIQVQCSFAVLLAMSSTLYFIKRAYIKTREEAFYYKREKHREEWELMNFPDGEEEEMIELYTARGMQEDDARIAVSTMAKYKEFFIDVMMVQELGMLPPDEVFSSLKNVLIFGLGSFLSALCPIIFYYLIAVSQLVTIDSATCIASIISCGVLYGTKMAMSDTGILHHRKLYMLGPLRIHVPYYVECGLMVVVGTLLIASLSFTLSRRYFVLYNLQ